MHRSSLLILLFSIGVCLLTEAQTKIIKPSLVSNKKAFAIIIDHDTYLNTEDAVKAYQKTIESDGLPTYIISGTFNRPEDVKKEIAKLYKTKQSLEGVVFIGDIPIPMIYRSSDITMTAAVPSDRFYDDLNLAFEYIKQDTAQGNLHYYNLSESIPLQINPSFYSARIYYPNIEKKEAHEAINKYLLKVARTRRDNVLDHVVTFTDTAYYSGCINAWKDEIKGYKEYFPFLAKQVNGLKQLDPNNSTGVLNEMLRKDVDLYFIRANSNTNVLDQDPATIEIQPLYIILEVNGTGAFNKKNYTAGDYIFNPGNTIVARASTSDIDKESKNENYLGLLSYGIRFGHVHNLDLNLGRHLFGDPTFHFASKDTENINEKITQENNTEYWKSLINKSNPAYQNLALLKLSSDNSNFSTELLDYFNKSSYCTVRLQSLDLLSSYKNDNFTDAVSKGLTDEYEAVAWQASKYAGEIGDTVLVPSLVHVWANDRSRLRIQKLIISNFDLFDRSLIERSLIQALKNSNRLHKEREIETIKTSFKQSAPFENVMERIKDKTAPEQERLALIQSIHGINYHPYIDAYLDIIDDKQESHILRTAAANNLGTFSYSWKRKNILFSYQAILKTKIPKELRREIERTLAILKTDGALASINVNTNE